MRKLINNPLFRLAGVIIILYFALFKNGYEADSLKNRLKPERVKSNLGEISSNSIHIIDAIKKANEIKDLESSTQTDSKNLNLITTDATIGKGKTAFCNSKIDFEYIVANASKKTLQKNRATVIIGSGEFSLVIENEIIGMRRLGSRLVAIPANYKTTDKKLSSILSKYSNQSLAYQIDLLKVQNSSQNYTCN
jgi:hypothetical protein